MLNISLLNFILLSMDLQESNPDYALFCVLRPLVWYLHNHII